MPYVTHTNGIGIVSRTKSHSRNFRMNAGGREHDVIGREQILRRRDDPLNRQQWLFGSTVNQGPWLSKEEPCTSRITHTGQLSPAQLLHLVDRGEYVMHQWLWDAAKKGNFFIVGKNSEAFAFVLSQERPAESDTFTISADHLRRSCVPDNRCFNLRANQQSVKRASYDLLMEAKRQVRGRRKVVMSGCINNRRRWTGWQRRGEKAVLHCWIPRLMPIDNSNSGGKIPGNWSVQ